MMKTYIINLEDGKPKSITCRVCNMTSFHPSDIEHKYCGKCCEFHNIMAMKQRNALMTAGHTIESMVIAVPTKQRGRDLYIIVTALMVAALIYVFYQMVQRNTGIVKELGVMNAIGMSMLFAYVGFIIGTLLTKLYKWARNRRITGRRITGRR